MNGVMFVAGFAVAYIIGYKVGQRVLADAMLHDAIEGYADHRLAELDNYVRVNVTQPIHVRIVEDSEGRPLGVTTFRHPRAGEAPGDE